MGGVPVNSCRAVWGLSPEERVALGTRGTLRGTLHAAVSKEHWRERMLVWGGGQPGEEAGTLKWETSEC